MRKWVVIILFVLMAVPSAPHQSHSEEPDSLKDSRELQYQDMLMLFLGEKIEEAVSDHYEATLSEPPLVYPYQIDVINVERVHGFRSFHFKMTIETTPVVGPHISVGKDRMSFEISPTISEKVKLIDYNHLETHQLPPNWQHILKGKNRT